MVYSRVGSVSQIMDQTNTPQYLAMRNAAFVNDGAIPASSSYDVNGTWDTKRYTNWQKVPIGNRSKYSNTQVSISGGNANTQYLIGGGYHRETTVMAAAVLGHASNSPILDRLPRHGYFQKRILPSKFSFF